MNPGWPRIDVVLIGAQKAGSTHLAEVLRRHPDVFMCPDEVPFFEDPFYANSDPAELAAAVRGAGPAQLRGIYRPDYLGHPEASPRIARHAPEARVIAVLREPVERAISAYCWYVQFALLPPLPAEEGLSALLDGWADPRYPHGGEVLSYGLYGRHLRHWRESLPADQLLVLTPGRQPGADGHERMFAFLGLDPGRLPPLRDVRTNPGVYEPRRLRFLHARARFGFSWDSTDRYVHRSRRLRRPMASVLGAATNGFDRFILARLWGNDQPQLSGELRARLVDYYAADGEVLAEVLGEHPQWSTV